MARALLETSVLVARAQGRPFGEVPDEAAISVLTLAELRYGTLLASDPGQRERSLRALAEVEREFEALPIDRAVANVFAEIRARGRRAGRMPAVLDALIAATAMAHGLRVYTIDTDFDAIEGLEVVRAADA